MITKPKKNRILSLSIIDKAMKAINDVGEIDQQIKNNLNRYKLFDAYYYYEAVVEELNDAFKENKEDLEKINYLYLLRERLYRIINPTIYLNAYHEKRANDAIYINANVGFIDEKGKVKNVVVFMGKSEETDINVLRTKIENNNSYIESVKEKVIEKLLSKINIDKESITALRQKRESNKFRKDVTEKLLNTAIKRVNKLASSNKNLENDLIEISALIRKAMVQIPG